MKVQWQVSQSERARYDGVLLEKITQSFKSSDRTYVLAAYGTTCWKKDYPVASIVLSG
jgi:hypothetical protein